MADSVSRRSFIQKTSTGAAAVVAAGTIGVNLAEAKDAQQIKAALPEGTPQTWIHETLQVGDVVLGSWAIQSVSPVFAGGIVLQLADSDQNQLRIDVCQFDSSSNGVEASGKCDLVLMNGGNGRKWTARDHHLVVRAVSARLDTAQTDAHNAAPLLSHRQRLDVFGAAKLASNPA